jgi:hypothetical protein
MLLLYPGELYRLLGASGLFSTAGLLRIHITLSVFKLLKNHLLFSAILIHWVNSILAYCVDDDDVDEKDKDILPIILFCATHSDEFNQV